MLHTTSSNLAIDRSINQLGIRMNEGYQQQQHQQQKTVQSTPGGMHGRSVRYYSSTVLPQRNKMDTTRPPCMTLRSKMKALNK